jgi:hypothetical protein
MVAAPQPLLAEGKSERKAPPLEVLGGNPEGVPRSWVLESSLSS